MSHRLLAFKAVQLAVAAHPVEALKVCDSIDRCELTGLPTLILAWAHIIALGDLGRPMLAAKIAEEIAPMAAASPGTAYYQAVILTVYYTEALILRGDVCRKFWRSRAKPHGIAPTRPDAHRRSQPPYPAGWRWETAICIPRSSASDARSPTSLTTPTALPTISALTTPRRLHVPATSTPLPLRSRECSGIDIRPSPTEMPTASWPPRGCCRRAGTHRGLVPLRLKPPNSHAQTASTPARWYAYRPHFNSASNIRPADLPRSPSSSTVHGQVWWPAGPRHQDHDGEALLAISHDIEAMGDRIAFAGRDAAAHASLEFRRQNRRGPALTAGGRAERLIDECGGVTFATQAAAMPLPLTDREREIATLVAQGLSNSEIADFLTLSVRTIEGHIYRACARVDVATRAELARPVPAATPAAKISAG